MMDSHLIGLGQSAAIID
eukprot:Gb_28987 [translate_table: standard]